MEYCKAVTLKNGKACIIRNGTEEDAEGVLSSFIVTHGQTDFLSTYPDETTITPEQEKAYLKMKAENDRAVFLVAEADGVITGTALVDCVRDTEKARHRASFGISIDKAWWGIGIGRAMTEACIECARIAGYSQMELAVVSENERAIALYKSVGFAEYGRLPKAFRPRKGGWQEDLLMRLDLEEKKPQKGRILFLNGVTSSGKTSIVEALQARRDVFFYVVANDLFQEMVGEDYLREDYWKYLGEVIIMMYHTAKLYSDLGKNVIIDGILVEREGVAPHYERLLSILRDNPLDIVEVFCPPEICRQRNLARGDRYESQSEEQAALMAGDIRYSMRVDTGVFSPEECADRILRKLFGVPGGGGGEK